MSKKHLPLSQMAHGGGCGCKLSPAVLRNLLAKMPRQSSFSELLVGTETSDDAAVWQLDDNTCLISTTDFFTPIVDDARDFGRIAATNALSDVYAMGGKPIFALAILGMPLGKIEPSQVQDILEGGREVCETANIPIAGGHSIDSPEPIYGLVVNGICIPSHLKRNCDAKPGDAVILTKPLGVGIYSAAFKKNALSTSDYATMLESMTKLNSIGTVLGQHEAVHAMTDVTGFGILGHGLEMARGSNLQLTLNMQALPLLPRAKELVQAGFVTGASSRNWESYGDEVTFLVETPSWHRPLLTDPQTSGGLLIACDASYSKEIVSLIRTAGYHAVEIVGHMQNGSGIKVA